jgi:hypothetical protein
VKIPYTLLFELKSLQSLEVPTKRLMIALRPQLTDLTKYYTTSTVRIKFALDISITYEFVSHFSFCKRSKANVSFTPEWAR